MAYDKRTGKQLREGAEVNYNNVDSSLLKYDETTGDSITSSNLQTNSKIPKLPNDKIIDNPSFDLPKSELDSEVARINKEKAQSESEISGLLKDIGITKGSEADIATKEGADKAQKEYDQYTSDLEAEKRRIDKFERDLLRNNPTGALRGGQADILANAKRDSLEKQADIAILGNAAKGRYDTAMDIAKRKVESALVPLQAELDAKKFVYENNKDLFSTAQLSKLNTLIKADEAKIESERKTKETIENLKIEAYKNGFRGDLAGVKTLDEALTRVGSFLATPTTDVIKLSNGNTLLVDKRTGKTIKNFGDSNSKMDISSFNSLINTTSALENTVAGKESVKNDLTYYLSNEDYKGAYNQIANTVAQGLPATKKEQFESARIDREVLANFKNDLQAFKDAGGDTGLLRGSAENISRKLLGITNNPELTSLAVQLERSFQSYRQNMTGAAFSPSESREYAAVNPTGKKSFDLNIAVIDGSIKQLDNLVLGTIRAKVPQSKDIEQFVGVIEKNEQDLKNNPFLMVTQQSIGQIFNPNQGWIIPTN